MIYHLVFEVYYDGNLKEILHSYLGDLKYIVGNIRKDKMITINGYLLYDIGDGELKKVEILKSSFYIDDAEYELLDISRVENQIKMEIKTNNKVLQIDELEVKNLSFKTKYQTSINYKPLYISLIVSGIITMVGVILVSYYRKNKKRKINR